MPSHELPPLSIRRLEEKIRTGSEPENPMLIRVWLSHGLSENAPTAYLRAQYTAKFQLLLETIVDELVPVHWRISCLDCVYLPLSSLKKLSDCEASEQHLQALLNELAVSTRYVERSLTIS
ncbi:MAG: hypothetical protein MK214_04025 [Thalassotalea sp.]|nr:hypothetical protein [Thalassotalea sp.]